MPRASSRSSASAPDSSASASSRSAVRSCAEAVTTWLRASRSASATVTSRCWAPSCRSRSTRRPAARGAVARLHDAGPGGGDLAQLVADLVVQPLVLHREARARGYRGDELGLAGQRLVVPEDGDPLAVAVEVGHRAAVTRFHDHLGATGVDERALLRPPEGELERRVVQRAGQDALEP